jgi:hypothetical protein
MTRPDRRRVLVEADGYTRPTFLVLVQDRPGEGSSYWQAGRFRDEQAAKRLARRCRALLRRGEEPREVLGKRSGACTRCGIRVEEGRGALAGGLWVHARLAECGGAS